MGDSNNAQANRLCLFPIEPLSSCQHKLAGSARPPPHRAEVKRSLHSEIPCRESDQSGWMRPVSYTHLDVYKRQSFRRPLAGLALQGAKPSMAIRKRDTFAYHKNGYIAIYHTFICSKSPFLWEFFLCSCGTGDFIK